MHALLQAGAVDAELFDNPFLPVVLVGEHPRAPDVFHPERYRRQWHGAGVTHVLLRLPGLGVARTVESRVDPVETRVGSVGFHVAELTPEGAPIFDFSNQPAFYFFFDRPNPTRFYQIPIMSPPEFQREAIADLERAKPPLVIRITQQHRSEQNERQYFCGPTPRPVRVCAHGLPLAFANLQRNMARLDHRNCL